VTFLYIDSSAWVKRYYHERGSERIHQLFSSGDARVCSVLGLVEVVATLARKCRSGEISRESLTAKTLEIERDWQGFVQIELTLSMLDRAKDAAARFALRGSDAVHFAALQVLHQRLLGSGQRVLLVASDRELVEVAQAGGFEVLDPGTVDQPAA
jgi:predicted nucleic acid-binding protein